MTEAPSPPLKRVLGTVDGVAILVGITIGSGIFRTPGRILDALGSPWLVLAAWGFGGLVALLGSLCFAEVGSLHPETGGQFIYLRRAFGPRAGFLFGWAALVAFKPTSIAAISVTFGDYLVSAFRPGAARDPLHGRLAAAGCIALLTFANVRGVRLGALIQKLFTAGKLAALLFIVAVVLLSGHGDATHLSVSVPRAEGRTLFAAFGVALMGIFWSFDGWADLSYMCGEVRDPTRRLKRIFISGVLVVTGMYLLANLSYLLALHPAELRASTAVATDAVAAAFQTSAARLVAIFICVSTFGAVNGSIMSGARIFFAMARERLFFRSVSSVHPTWGTPAAAILLQSTLAIALVFCKSFDQLIDSFTFTSFLFYGPAVATIFVFRRTMKEAPRPFRVPLYPLVPLLFLLATALFLARAFLTDIAELRDVFAGHPTRSLLDLEAFLSLLVLAAGLVVYPLWRRRQSTSPS